METLTGNYNFEITATGGIPETIVGQLATLPLNLSVSPRLEDFAVVAETKKSVVLLGLDLIGEVNLLQTKSDEAGSQTANAPADLFSNFPDDHSIWAGSSLGWKKNQTIPLIIGDREHQFTVRGIYDDQNQPAILMDIAAAQRAFSRTEKVDRILLRVPEPRNADVWTKQIGALLPPGIELRPAGTGTEENRKMLAAFRWNLKLLSYIALIVGAFLIYNTVSVSVVRRRAEIGIARALGASRMEILLAFTGEAAVLGVVGAALGIPLGRVMAAGAVKLMGTTVDALYVSSRPGPIELNFVSILSGLVVGIGVAVIAAYAPARKPRKSRPSKPWPVAERNFSCACTKCAILQLPLFSQ